MPEGARLVDGGTAGMDVAFQMRGAERVVIVDAAATGSAPGTMFRVPGAEAGRTARRCRACTPIRSAGTTRSPSPAGRWGRHCPTDITVFLIEAAGVEMGADLSEPVTAAMEQVIALIERDYLGPLRPPVPREVTVEFTADGYLRLDAATAAARFPSDAVAAVLARRGPVAASRCAGRAAAVCCSNSALPPATGPSWSASCLREIPLVGVHRACWDDEHSALCIPVPGERETVIAVSSDVARAVETVVVADRGQWAVDIVVVFDDGVVRKRISTHRTRRRAELAADLIKRAAERDLT